jgi:hypothetical protein
MGASLLFPNPLGKARERIFSNRPVKHIFLLKKTGVRSIPPPSQSMLRMNGFALLFCLLSLVSQNSSGTPEDPTQSDLKADTEIHGPVLQFDWPQ